MFKEFWKFFFSRFVVHIHALRKIRFKVSKSMDPRMLAKKFFFEREIHSFFRQRGFFSYLMFTNFFFLSAKLKQGWDKTARIKHRGTWQNAQSALWNVTYASFICCANFIIEAQKRPCLISSTNLGTLPNKIEKFLAGVCPKSYASKVYGSITPKFINQNSTPCQTWLKKAI